jgi:solute carrier family 25 (mitochondrial carnitine/acylcarnitine transporter), member 20/29
MDILRQTLRNEGFFALYKGMASPLLGIAGVNSLLFASYGASKRLISPYGNLSLRETALAGAMAGAANAVLASPGGSLPFLLPPSPSCLYKANERNSGNVQSPNARPVRPRGRQAAARRRERDVARVRRAEGYHAGVLGASLVFPYSSMPLNMSRSPQTRQVTLAREIPAYAGFYTAFEFSKRQFKQVYGEGEEVPVWGVLGCGATGGVRAMFPCLLSFLCGLDFCTAGPRFLPLLSPPRSLASSLSLPHQPKH